MSWSVSASGKRDEAIREVTRQYGALPKLPPGEQGRAQTLMTEVVDFARSAEPGDVLTISAYGSESSAWKDDTRVKVLEISGGYRVSVSEPVELPVRSEVDAGG